MCQGETQRAKVPLNGHQRTVCRPQSCLSAVLSCTMSQFSFAATVTQICKQGQRHQTPSNGVGSTVHHAMSGISQTILRVSESLSWGIKSAQALGP